MSDSVVATPIIGPRCNLARSILVLLVLASVPVIGSPAGAQTLSAGCTDANNPSYDNQYQSGTIPGRSFRARERITLTAAQPATAPVTSILLRLDGIPVDTEPFPGSISYTFSFATAVQELRWDSSPGGAVTWTVECGAPQLVLTPASGPGGTTATVTNDPADANALCTGGFLGSQNVDLDVVGPAGEEIDSSAPQFDPPESAPDVPGGWTATFTVPAGLVAGDEIRVAATCTALPLLGIGVTFNYEESLFTVTAAPTNGGGTTTTTRSGTTTGGTTIPPGGGGRTPVPTPLAIQPRFAG